MGPDFGQVGNFRKVADFNALADREDANRLQMLMQQAAFARQQKTDALDDQWRRAAAGLTGDPEKDFPTLLAIDPAKAIAYRKSGFEALKEKRLGDTAEIDRRKKAMEYYQTLFDTNVRDPKSARDFVMHSYTDPTIGPILQQHGSLDEKLAEIPDDPQAFKQWQASVGIGLKKMAELVKVNNVNIGGSVLTQATQPVTGQVTTLATTPTTQSPDNAANQVTANRAIDAGYNGVTYQQTDGGLVELPTRRGGGGAPLPATTGVPGAPNMPTPGAAPGARIVTNPADGTPLGKPLKDIPTTEVAKIRTTKQSLNSIDRAIQATKDYPDAFGIVNAVPGAEKVRQRTDPTGVAPRAMVSNIGSLVLHDRSGAAVTVSEYPRLAPFIPTASDDAAAIRSKLTEMKRIAEEELGLFVSQYSPEQGYKPSPMLTPPRRPAPPPAAGSRDFVYRGRRAGGG